MPPPKTNILPRVVLEVHWEEIWMGERCGESVTSEVIGDGLRV